MEVFSRKYAQDLARLEAISQELKPENAKDETSE